MMMSKIEARLALLAVTLLVLCAVMRSTFLFVCWLVVFFLWAGVFIWSERKLLAEVFKKKPQR